MSTKTTMKGDYRGIERMKLLTTQEAADRLDVTPTRIRAMILAGRLPAEKFGHVHMIKEEDLALVVDRRPGRPPLTDEEKAARTEKKASSGAQASLFEAATTKKSQPKAKAKKAGVKKTAKKKGARTK